MEKVFFQSPEGGEGIEFFVLEQTRINGADYLLVAEEEEGDCEALILKDVSQAKDSICPSPCPRHLQVPR